MDQDAKAVKISCYKPGTEQDNEIIFDKKLTAVIPQLGL
jgi:hypothetical protein